MKTNVLIACFWIGLAFVFPCKANCQISATPPADLTLDLSSSQAIIDAGSAAAGSYNYDIPTVIAMINSHKRERIAMVAREGLEAYNKTVHNASKDKVTVLELREKTMDNVERAFDIIDMMVAGTRLSIGVVNFMNSIKGRLDSYANLYCTYLQAVENRIKQGKKLPVDGFFVGDVTVELIKYINDQLNDIYVSAGTIVVIMGESKVTGMPGFRARAVSAFLDNILQDLDNIDAKLDATYRRIYNYIGLSKLYWKEELQFKRTREEICTERVDIWKARMGEMLSIRNGSY